MVARVARQDHRGRARPAKDPRPAVLVRRGHPGRRRGRRRARSARERGAMTVTKAEVEQRIAGLDVDTAKAVICALTRHSQIQTHCFGYYSCGRCEAQVGDSLGGSYVPKRAVIVGHNCETCRENAAALTWEDTLMAPDPFAPETVAEEAPAP